MANLTLIRGIPGSGKSTYAKKNFKCLHVEADMYYQQNGLYQWDPSIRESAHSFCYDVFSLAVDSYADVVVSNTFVKLWEMKKYIDRAGLRGYEVEVICMKTFYGNIHNVPDEVVKRMEANFEVYEGEAYVTS